jgi:hypothetical protein
VLKALDTLVVDPLFTIHTVEWIVSIKGTDENRGIASQCPDLFVYGLQVCLIRIECLWGTVPRIRIVRGIIRSCGLLL